MSSKGWRICRDCEGAVVGAAAAEGPPVGRPGRVCRRNRMARATSVCVCLCVFVRACVCARLRLMVVRLECGIGRTRRKTGLQTRRRPEGAGGRGGYHISFIGIAVDGFNMVLR